jgi:predicted O-methyltransferase YrrM
MSSIWPRNRREVTDWEGGVLEKHAAQVEPPYIIVEIGSYRGRSTIFLARSSVVPVVAVDLWHFHPNNDGYRAKETKKHFDHAVAPFGDRIKPMMMSSEIASKRVISPIGLLFIDGDHSRESVMKDCLFWGKKVHKGGTIIFHDYHVKRVRGGVRDAKMVERGWKLERISKRLCVARR